MEILKKKSRGFVHIVYVGYEVDRVVKPISKYLKDEGIDKVYLITDEDKQYEDRDSRGYNCLRVVKRKLQYILKDKFNPKTDIFYLKSRFKVSGIMSQTCRIIREEKERGMEVYINISPGNKLMSSAGTIMGLMYDAKIYYVEPRSYDSPKGKKSLCQPVAYGMKSLKFMPTGFTIEGPSDALIYTVYLTEKYNGLVTQEELILELIKKGVISTDKIIGVTIEDEKELQSGKVPERVRNHARRLIFSKIKRYMENTGSKRQPNWRLTLEGKRLLRIFLAGNPHYRKYEGEKEL
ncbi:MAG: DUF6293 family protein [Candidatus Altiarchaeia archaeon]